MENAKFKLHCLDMFQDDNCGQFCFMLTLFGQSHNYFEHFPGNIYEIELALKFRYRVIISDFVFKVSAIRLQDSCK